ncbi:DUF1990 family protein [Microlunatus capsulatus]|uniref:Uncharacterized protein (UPF0548 family) n=1 Tax=Microlunatus capsulatus TaxID=99117 RepID=A0ABS4Z2J5_9ACTN|nr:DUF1990 domain-containing protein [Microlunatus capsulatus]MBP2415263.1 uncharacterized protein (UPF0548 family) [Microlunatus capsulatus]
MGSVAELMAPAAALALQTAGLTYPEVGATRSTLPAGYHHQHVSARVGQGRAAFEAAGEALLTWRVHEGAGLSARVSDHRVRVGTVAELRLGPRRVGLRIPVRVLEVVEDDHRLGFVYGTLPGHPERGEESFTVELAADGAVFFDLVAFSRGGRWFTVLGAPLARAGQYLVTERYVSAARTAARGGRPRP